MIHHLYTHDWHPWRSRVSRINGAWTYSKDIVQHYVSHIESTLKAEGIYGPTVVSTCAPLAKHVPQDVIQNATKYTALVQFLHTWPRERPMQPIQELFAKYAGRVNNLIVVSAYWDYHQAINKEYKGSFLSSRYLPMRIGDMLDIKRKGPEKKNAVWFGNLYSAKSQMHEQVKRRCKELGVDLITIAEGKIIDYHSPRGRGISQREAWQICANSKMVFAVGRCALEAYALGCHVIIVGDAFGGTVQNYEDWLTQESTNFNTRKHTGHQNLTDAIKTIASEKFTTTPYICHERLFCSDMVKNGVIQWK